MRTMTAAAVALMLTCGALFAGEKAGQQGGPTGGGASDQQMSQEKTMTATVDNVNADQKKITVTGPKGNKAEYTLSNSTVITTRSGERLKIGDLKPGAKIAVTYTGTPDNPEVTKVEVQKGT